ncbi:Bug family tripartite tricarboxylate transporter substrate binding protein [Bordetella trematum]|uniref:Bug family tripartite tricarboxylate transporter substrate binding protein n=1 Tax=Bordetella trematum TaxID=123899 RepID=UPI000D9499B9|nr:tripartite tricarboxylate transporter substrate binding protein [Bordetella trematum]QIM70885.1 tripartite tricarboxylate transporter substrate binding protein [Bordetella trematum]SPU48672.1 tricarboxylate transport protein tctC [Bordetella trematum]VDH05029.1 Tripartite tricarboxylate transporter family receptor [Bordetella trematum]
MQILKKFRLGAVLALGVAGLGSSLSAQAASEPRRPECIAPAQPGGGFDLTCRLATESLKQSEALKTAMRIIYMPGGIGAVAYNNIVAQHPNEPGTIVAFSGGSLLNLAQGKFGKYNVNDVRWLAGIGADYGVAVVRNDSPYQDLKSLMDAFKEDPTKIVLGAGGTVGSQDWMKAALTAKAAGVDFRKMRFVAFEGGGEAVTALRGGHIQAYMGDAAEAFTMLEGGAPIRVLAVFNDERLPGKLSGVPTAKEQGYDIVWPIIRGFYMGPKVSDADYQFWVDAFNKAMAAPEYAKLREQFGLFPFSKTGKELDDYVKEQVKGYTELADSFGLIKK